MLTGTPNVGKTTLFNALTGRHRRTGNYHGVTAEISRAESIIGGIGYVYDLPGLYTMRGGKTEEKRAAESLENLRGVTVVQVADCRYLARSLPLTKELIARGKRVVIAFTMSESLVRRGGKINAAAMTKKIGVPCVCVNALNKKSVREFAEFLVRNERAENIKSTEAAEDNKNAGEANAKSAETARRTVKAAGYTFSENEYMPPKSKKAPSAIYSALWLLPAFFLVVAGVFYLAFGSGSIGVYLKDKIENAFSYLADRAEESIGNPFLKSVICGGLLRGTGGVFSFLPQIAILYFFSDFLEESGVMSALAYATDGFFSLLNLSGRAAFCIFLGYGCTAAGIASAAALENEGAKRRAIACLYFVPCSAKLPVYLTLLSSLVDKPLLGAAALYVLGTGAGLLISAFCGGKEEDFIMEIADFSLPSPLFLLNKLLFQLKGFIIKVSTTVLCFTLAAYTLASFNFSGACEAENSILAALSRIFVFAFYPMGVKDWRAAFAAIGGAVAKENVSGLLAALCPEGLRLDRAASAAYLIFVALIPPCVAAVSAAAKEIGKKAALKYALLQIAAAFVCAYAVYFVFSRNIAKACLFAALAGSAIFAVSAIRKKLSGKHEKTERRYARKKAGGDMRKIG